MQTASESMVNQTGQTHPRRTRPIWSTCAQRRLWTTLAPATQQDEDSEPRWLQRLRAEQRDLAERYESLFSFIESSSFHLVDAVQKNLLRQQVNLEHKLLQLLNQRIHGAAERHLRSKNHG